MISFTCEKCGTEYYNADEYWCQKCKSYPFKPIPMKCAAKVDFGELGTCGMVVTKDGKQMIVSNAHKLVKNPFKR